MIRPLWERDHPAGMGSIQKLYGFANGYGASAIQTPYSYGGDRGLWELAVLEITDPDCFEYELDYSTPITDDVIGYLDESEIQPILERIKGLPMRHNHGNSG